MIKLKDNISLTLVEVLVAMLILSSSAAGVIGSFSYALKFVQRAGKKIEAVNLGRKATEWYRAIWLCDPYDSRLDIQTDTDITDEIAPSGYDGTIKLTIKEHDSGAKQMSVNVEWSGP